MRLRCQSLLQKFNQIDNACVVAAAVTRRESHDEEVIRYALTWLLGASDSIHLITAIITTITRPRPHRPTFPPQSITKLPFATTILVGSNDSSFSNLNISQSLRRMTIHLIWGSDKTLTQRLPVETRQFVNFFHFFDKFVQLINFWLEIFECRCGNECARVIVCGFRVRLGQRSENCSGEIH